MFTSCVKANKGSCWHVCEASTVGFFLQEVKTKWREKCWLWCSSVPENHFKGLTANWNGGFQRCFPFISLVYHDATHFFSNPVWDVVSPFVFLGGAKVKKKNGYSWLHRRLGLAHWHRLHLLSHCPRLSAAEQSVLCVLSCSLCFIQLHYRDRIPLHPEPRTIMSFGTAELVRPFTAHTGAVGLIGSWPYGTPSGLSTGEKRHWMQRGSLWHTF